METMLSTLSTSASRTARSSIKMNRSRKSLVKSFGLSCLAASTSTQGVAAFSTTKTKATRASLSALAATSLPSSTSTNICGARALGGSDLVVSEACLGTMTWGVQNDASDAFAQIDYARSRGCNFIDTAELYPVPLTAPEYRAGATEEILGQYIEKIGPSERDELVIASKICGFFPSSPVAAARSYPAAPIDPAPDCRLDAKSVKDACDASLRRLRTDRIDLMQIHWPDRYVPLFGTTTFHHSQKREDAISIRETAEALKGLIDEGKIRYIGLSNESTLGVCEWVKACEEFGIRDKLATIQNSYSLLDRRFDSELAEACDFYNIGLLPWSVLAGGLLSGKYNKGVTGNCLPSTPNSRFNRFPDYMQRWHPSTASEESLYATEEYAKIARDIGMAPSELAIAFIRTRKFVADNGSIIVGATSLEQLKENLAPFDGTPVELDAEVLSRIDQVHMKCRDASCSL